MTLEKVCICILAPLRRTGELYFQAMFKKVGCIGHNSHCPGEDVVNFLVRKSFFERFRKRGFKMVKSDVSAWD